MSARKYRIEGLVTLRPAETGVFTDKASYKKGETVAISFVNASDRDIRPSGVVPFRIETQDGKVVYSPVQILILPAPIAPGQESKWEWKQTDNDGKQVPTGAYKVILTTMDPPAEYTASFQIA